MAGGMRVEPEVRAERMTFGLQLVITLVSTVVSIVVTLLLSTAGLRSDIRDINTRLEFNQQAVQQLRDQLKAVAAEQQLQRYDVNDLKVSAGIAAGRKR